MSITAKFRRTLNALAYRSYWYDQVMFKGCKKFWTLKEFNLDAINLGSTAAYHAFDYSTVNVKAANLALNAQYLLADYEILKNYSSHLKPGGTVILGTSLFSLDGYDVTYFDDRYYTILYPASIWHFSMQRLKKIMNIKRDPIMHIPLMSLLDEVKCRLRKPKETMTDADMEKNASNWMEMWRKEFSIDSFEDPMTLRNRDLKNQAIEIMKDIKTFCDKKGFRLVVVLPPVSIALRKHLTPNLRKLYVETFMREPQLSDIEYKSYIDDSAFNDTTLFKNAYILNKAGSQLFTKRVFTDLGLL